MAKIESGIQSVICDAGPVIHLDELGCINLLDDFQTLFIPDVVWQEILRHRPEAIPYCESIAQRISTSQPMTPEMESVVQLFSLHAGEIQALSIAQHHDVDLFLTDDTAARLAAGALSIKVHGTLGILLRAIRRNQRTPQEVITTLKCIPEKSTLHLKSSLLQEIIDQVIQNT